MGATARVAARTCWGTSPSSCLPPWLSLATLPRITHHSISLRAEHSTVVATGCGRRTKRTSHRVACILIRPIPASYRTDGIASQRCVQAKHHRPRCVCSGCAHCVPALRQKQRHADAVLGRAPGGPATRRRRARARLKRAVASPAARPSRTRAGWTRGVRNARAARRPHQID